MTTLPPLPEPDVHFYPDRGRYETFTADQMRAYGEACAISAIHSSQRAQDEAYAAGVAHERERIASWIEGQRNFIPATGAEFAAAIRSAE